LKTQATGLESVRPLIRAFRARQTVLAVRDDQERRQTPLGTGQDYGRACSAEGRNISMDYDAQTPSKPPPKVRPEDWRYLSCHLGEERLNDLHVLLGECPYGFGAKLVAEIRTLLPHSQPGHALVLALARVAYDADQPETRLERGSPKEQERRRDEPL